jgi:hypothetical protein
VKYVKSKIIVHFYRHIKFSRRAFIHYRAPSRIFWSSTKFPEELRLREDYKFSNIIIYKAVLINFKVNK